MIQRTATMERKRGRPKTGARNTAGAMLDAELMAKARQIAADQGVGITAYLNEVLRPRIATDYAKLVQKTAAILRETDPARKKGGE